MSEKFKRKELKYLINLEQYQQLMKFLKPHIIEDQYPYSLISNIYYDTPNYYLIRKSLEKPIYKEKFRIRGYGNLTHNDLVFVELKKKYKGIVYKRREKINLYLVDKLLNGDLNTNQIRKEIAYFIKFYSQLQPKILLSYERMAYVFKNNKNIRITFDKNILWRTENISLLSGVYGNKLLPDNMFLLEIKIAGAFPNDLAKFLSQHKIFKTSYSKYGEAYKQIIRKSEELIYG